MNGHCYCGCTEAFLGRGRKVRKWEKRQLRWFIADWLPSLLRVHQALAYQAAFDQWARVCGLTFEQTTEREEADILFLTRPIDGINGTLAEAQLPYGNDEQLRVWLDVADNFSVQQPSPPDKIDLVTIVTHEAGHLMGLGHTNEPNNLMGKFYDPAIRSPQGDDIYEAQRRYGKPEQPPEPAPAKPGPLLVRVEDVALDIVWTGELFPERVSET